MRRKARNIAVICLATFTIAAAAVSAAFGLGVAPYALSLFFLAAPARLPVPVEGVSAASLHDTWGAPRSGGRRHEGIDIFGDRGTKIFSVTEGVVTTVGDDPLGGRRVGVLGPGGYWHYYAHLERYGAVRRGLRIKAGHVIGTVGNSGNARGTPPHLHYGIYKIFGGAHNPYPLLNPSGGR